LASVREVEAHGDTLSLSVEGPLDAVVKRAAAFTVVNVETREPSLEDLFLTYFGTDGAGPDSPGAAGADPTDTDPAP
jgi:ABC-2 type transport system ATP-binding protein